MISTFCIVKKPPKIGKNPLIIDLVFHQNFAILQCAQNIKQLISVQAFASCLTAELGNIKIDIDQMGGGLQATTIVICNVV